MFETLFYVVMICALVYIVTKILMSEHGLRVSRGAGRGGSGSTRFRRNELQSAMRDDTDKATQAYAQLRSENQPSMMPAETRRLTSSETFQSVADTHNRTKDIPTEVEVTTRDWQAFYTPDVLIAEQARTISVAIDSAMTATEIASTILYFNKGFTTDLMRKLTATADKAVRRLPVSFTNQMTSLKLTTSVGVKVVKKAVQTLVAKLTSRLVTRLMLKFMAAIVRFVGMAVFGAATGIGLAFLAIDIILNLVDVLDLMGMNNFTPNAMIDRIVRVCVGAQQREIGRKPPVLNPMIIWPYAATRAKKAWEQKWIEALLQHFQAVYTNELTKESEDGMNFINQVLQRADARLQRQYVLFASGTQEQQEIAALVLLQEGVTLFEEMVYSGHDLTDDFKAAMTNQERDRIYFQEFKKHLSSEHRRYVKYVQELSDEDDVGMSLTEEGVQWWNETHKYQWYRYYDLFFPKENPNNYKGQTMVAYYSDQYLVLDDNDPGNENDPIVTTKYLNEETKVKVSFYIVAPFAVSFCEKARNVGVMGNEGAVTGAIDPVSLGVKWSNSAPQCVVTRRYCEEFGMAYHSGEFNGAGECKYKPGQEAAAWVFGTNTVQAASSLINELDKVLGKEPTCPEGKSYRPVGKDWRGAGCYDHTPCPDGTYPIEHLSGDYSCRYDRGVGIIPRQEDMEPCKDAFVTQTGIGECWSSGGRGAGFTDTGEVIETAILRPGDLLAGNVDTGYNSCLNDSLTKRYIDHDNEHRKSNPDGTEKKYYSLWGLGGYREYGYKPGTPGHGKDGEAEQRPENGCFDKPTEGHLMYERPYAEKLGKDNNGNPICLKQMHCEKWRKDWHIWYPPCPYHLPVDHGANFCHKADGVGITQWGTDRYKCKDEEYSDLVDGLCYKKPKDGFTCVATYCESGPRVGDWSGHPDQCSDDGWVYDPARRRCFPQEE